MATKRCVAEDIAFMHKHAWVLEEKMPPPPEADVSREFVRVLQNNSDRRDGDSAEDLNLAGLTLGTLRDVGRILSRFMLTLRKDRERDAVEAEARRRGGLRIAK